MGYWTTLSITGVRFSKRDAARVQRDLKAWRRFKTPDMMIFLSNAALTAGNCLCFDYNSDYKGDYPLGPDENQCTPAMDGKWSGDEQIARWIASHQGHGSISFHSLEGDGMAWMFEFDGKGRYRRHELSPARWKRPPKPKKAAKA